MSKNSKQNNFVNLTYGLLKPVFYAYVATVMFLSFMPVQHLGSDSDKINHIAAFTVYTILFSITYKTNKIKTIILAGLTFGIFIEFVQYFLPYRSCDYLDVIADLVGILIGFAITLIAQIKLKNH